MTREEAEALISEAANHRIGPQDRRLTGSRLPRFVDLDGPEASARIRRVVEQMRARYPHPEDALQRAREQVVFEQRLREEGFSEADRADLAEWLGEMMPKATP